MNHNIPLKFIFFISLVFFCLILLFKITNDYNEASLNNSLNLFLKDNLNFEYKIKKLSIGNSITDISAEWWIVLDNDSTNHFIKNTELQLADNADLVFFQNVIEEVFFIESKWLNSHLYRAEMPLGEGSVCETKSCNIYLLTDNVNIYVGIYTN